MARIYDNIETKFAEGLQGIITNVGVKRVDFCVGYFNLRGWNLVVEQIDTLTGDYVYENDKRIFRKCRLLIGMHRPAEELIRQLYTEQVLPDANYVSQCKLEIARDFKRQLQLGLPTKQDEFTLRRLSAQMKDEKVCVKLYLREPLHAKLYLAHRPDDNFNKIQAIMGSSNLTYSGLTKQGELNAEFGDSDSAEKLSRWFDDRWEDKFCLDITKELIEIIDNSWAGEKEIPPYYIYLKTAYHLSEEARTGIKEFTIPPEFKNSLFDFQQTAVKIAARHLNNEKRGGAMIGDVVGLGKTITACAIAKMYENTFGSNTLIICPANLQDMWAKYRRQYDLKADIMSMAKPIDVDNARYYKLIIVDESHNLRNSQGTRYRNIRDLIQKQDCKVLLLTATPYNKQYKDLSSQLRLFVDDDTDLGIRPEAYIREIGGERKFAEKHEDFIRSIKAFERSECQEDWQELMKSYKKDCFVGFLYGLQQAVADGVKNLVLDISLNGGGSTDNVGAEVALLRKNRTVQLWSQDVLEGYNKMATYYVDSNFDGVFDEKDDTNPKFDCSGMNIGVLSSPVAFSCGNQFLTLMKDYGFPIMGQRSAGGACCIQVMQTADGQNFAISTYRDRSTDKNFINNDPGVEPTEGYVFDYNHFYDLDFLKKILISN